MSKYLAPLFGVIAVISMIGNFLIYNRYSSRKPIVTVGNEPITKKTYQDALEFQDNGSTIKKLVYEALVMQEAQRLGVVPTATDVEARIADIERKSPQLIPDQNGDLHRYEVFKEDLKTDIALENIRIHGLTASEQEIQDFYNKNHGAFVLPTQVESTMVFTQTAVDAAAAEADLRQGLSEDVIGRQPRMHVVGVNNFSLNLNILPAGQREMITRAMLSASPGEVKTLAVGGAFLTFKIKANSKTVVPPLAKVHDLAARYVKLGKSPAAQVELAMLFQRHKPTFDNPRYEVYFLDAEHFNVPSSAQAR